MKISLHISLIVFASLCCSSNPKSDRSAHRPVITKNINPDGTTIKTRFNPPDGFNRQPCSSTSFGCYLQNLPLKPFNAKVKYYNGQEKIEQVYDAVVDMDIGKKDLQQCADAIIRLRGEYLFSQKEFDKISFTLTNGFSVPYREWIKGSRVKIEGNKTWWEKSTAPSNTYQDFRNYLNLVFTYAGTLSLSKSLNRKDIRNLTIGDVFITGGSPGHAVIVVDVAESKEGEKIFMVAQSYMPAQEIHILKNLLDIEISPWYKVSEIQGILRTPQWTFTTDNLKSW